MADWDESSPELHENLAEVLELVRHNARARDPITLETLKTWHRCVMRGLNAPNRHLVGSIRGESGLENVGVRIGRYRGVPASATPDEVERFFDWFGRALQLLDQRIAAAGVSTAGQAEAVIRLAARTHGEWVRIHPFGNGNGRIARLLTNAVLARYGLPPIVRLRPRPQDGYDIAGAASMNGNHELMKRWLVQQLETE